MAICLMTLSFSQVVLISVTAADENSVEISMTNTVDVRGFQFIIDLSELNGGESVVFGETGVGGSAEEAGFSVLANADEGIVVGISFTGGFIPPGEGVLTSIPWDVNFDEISGFVTVRDVTVVGHEGELDTGIGPPFSVNYYGCSDPDACNFIPGAIDDGSCLYADCNGECDGTAYLDDCGYCVGGSTGLEENYALDCTGICDGGAYENECGCVGGSTSLEPDFCFGCTDPSALNYDPQSIIDDGTCIYECVPGDVDGDQILNVIDIVQIVGCILTDSGACLCGDVNNDNTVDVLDVVQIVGIILQE